MMLTMAMTDAMNRGDGQQQQIQYAERQVGR